MSEKRITVIEQEATQIMFELRKLEAELSLEEDVTQRQIIKMQANWLIDRLQALRDEYRNLTTRELQRMGE